MREYLTLLNEVMVDGMPKSDRTGVGTRSLFGRQLRFDLNEGFPAVTTKKLQFKSVVYELLWFLRGETNVKWLNEHGVHIWDEWADSFGELGPVYGRQWRRWRGRGIANAGVTYDQISQVIYDLRTNPDSRRILVSAWNVAELGTMALQPCHVLFQFYVVNGRLSCQMYQRSADVFLGLPFNIASYALLTHMVAQVCKLEVDELIICLGDVHLYNNHAEQAREQTHRAEFPKPRLWLNPNITDIFNFEFRDIELRGYRHHPAIKAPVAV